MAGHTSLPWRKDKKILLLKDSGYFFKKGLYESAQLKKILIAQNIPEAHILIENKSRNTHENAYETALFVKKISSKKNLSLNHLCY